MRRYINWFLNGFAVTFAIPSFLIIISWNAIPGDSLYSLKTSLEQVALNVTIKTPLASILSVKYTERRFSEANTLLSKKGSTLGYTLLVAGANNSKKIISNKKDKTQAKELISKIQVYQKDIEEKKNAIQTGSYIVPTSTEPIPTQTPAQATPTLQTPNPTPIITETPTQVIDDLDNANSELEKIREDLEESTETGVFQTQNFQANPPLPREYSKVKTHEAPTPTTTPEVTMVPSESPSALSTESPLPSPQATP